jgi:CHAD domain-containing protein
LTLRQRDTGDPLNASLLDSFDRLRIALSEDLSVYEQRLEVPGTEHSLASAIADRVMPHADELNTRLAAVGSVHDETQAHEARIAAKRLRYLIEPAVPSIDDGKEVLAALKSLQDALGTLHDAHVMGHEIQHVLDAAATGDSTMLLAAPHDSLVALGKRVHEDARKAFDRVHDDWLDGRFADFGAELVTFNERLAALHA